MSRNSPIEWTQATWNPWHGCVKVSSGCKNCYMYRDKARYGQNPRLVRRSKTTFEDPLRWSEPRLIFTCSWSDWFIADADAWRQDAWDVVRRSPQHTFQILTKRPERILSNLPSDWGQGYPNVWLGVSIENQQVAYRKDILCVVPARVRFISAEPLLGPLSLQPLLGIQWVITGGESGPNARTMDLNWSRSIRDQCVEEQVAFFHKQHGGRTRREGSWGGRLLDGQTWDGMPFASQG